MNCYIETKCVNPQAPQADRVWIGEVVTEQDYYEGSAFAYSHRTSPHPDVGLACGSAKEWAEEMGYNVVHPDEI
jgi:hypothetical protein